MMWLLFLSNGYTYIHIFIYIYTVYNRGYTYLLHHLPCKNGNGKITHCFSLAPITPSRCRTGLWIGNDCSKSQNSYPQKCKTVWTTIFRKDLLCQNLLWKFQFQQKNKPRRFCLPLSQTSLKIPGLSWLPCFLTEPEPFTTYLDPPRTLWNFRTLQYLLNPPESTARVSSKKKNIQTSSHISFKFLITRCLKIWKARKRRKKRFPSHLDAISAFAVRPPAEGSYQLSRWWST